MRRTGLVLSFLLLFSLLGNTQSFYAVRRDRSLIATFGAGTSTYFGDLQNDGHIMDFRPNLSIGLQSFLSQHISIRTELLWFNIGASDKDAKNDRKQRNLSFNANNFEFNAVGIYNIFRMGNRFYRRPNINFYAFAGVGLLYMNPTTDYKGKTYALQPLATEGVKYSRFQFVIPYGLGIKFKTSPFLNVAIEGGYRMTFTDYMDDVSSARYPKPASLSSDLSRALSDRRNELREAQGKPDINWPSNLGKRGNPGHYDSYLLVQIKFEYYLPYNFGGDFNGIRFGKKKPYNSVRYRYKPSYRRRR